MEDQKKMDVTETTKSVGPLVGIVIIIIILIIGALYFWGQQLSENDLQEPAGITSTEDADVEADLETLIEEDADLEAFNAELDDIDVEIDVSLEQVQ